VIRIAIPVVNGKLSQHFGHCHSFTLLDIDDAAGSVVARQNTPAPPHEPGALPRWLAEQDVNLVVTGGMGKRLRPLVVVNAAR
jgi:ATP-binding protein involved in chromosome partitioning